MTATLISARGDDFNMARYLWANYQKAQTGRDPKFYLGANSPEYAWYQKAQDENLGSDGGFLAREDWSRQFFDIIRDGGAFRTLPVRREMADAKIQHVPVGMSEWTINYVGENTTLTSGDRKFADRMLTMHKATALATIPTELFRDASDLADQVFRQSAGEMVNFEQDKQTLFGTGQGSTPVGVLNTTNVGSGTPAAGAAHSPTPADLSTMIYNAKSLNQSANVPVGSTHDVAVVAHPRIEQTIRAQINATSQSSIPWLFGLGTDPIQRFLGTAWVLTGTIPITFSATNTPTGGSNSHIFCGDWHQLRVVTRSDFEFMLTPHPLMLNDQILCRIVFRYDVQVIHPEAFYVLINCSQ